MIENSKYYMYSVYSNTEYREIIQIDSLRNIDIYAFEKYSNKSISQLNKIYESITITLEINSEIDGKQINTISYINNNISNLPSNKINLENLIDSNTGNKLSYIIPNITESIPISIKIKTTQLEKSNGSEIIFLIRKNIQLSNGF